MLRDADLLLAEDTRHTRQLLHACGIAARAAARSSRCTSTTSATRVPRRDRATAGGRARRARERCRHAAGERSGRRAGRAPPPPPASTVVAVPGPCAAIAALYARGAAGGALRLRGLPAADAAARRRSARRRWPARSRTLVFYEAPHRLREALEDLAAAFGAERPAAVARELTKKFETRLSRHARRARAAGGDGRGHGARRDRAGGAGRGARGRGGRCRCGARAARRCSTELPVSQAAQARGAAHRARRARNSMNARCGCAAPQRYNRRGSRPGNRCAIGRGKSGLHRARCQVTPGGREPTESATESKPPKRRSNAATARVKGCGKSAPRRWQHRRHGKPHLEQDQIGKHAGFGPVPAARRSFRVGRSRRAATRVPDGWLPSTEPGLSADSHFLPIRFPRPSRPAARRSRRPVRCRTALSHSVPPESVPSRRSGRQRWAIPRSATMPRHRRCRAPWAPLPPTRQNPTPAVS